MTAATSLMWRLRSIAGVRRCVRSPSPVSDGVWTSWPLSRNNFATGLYPALPTHAPCTSTNTAISAQLFFGPHRCGGGGVLAHDGWTCLNGIGAANIYTACDTLH